VSSCDITHASVPRISCECGLRKDNRFWIHGTEMMVVRLQILEKIERQGLLPFLLCLLHSADCETLLHHRVSCRHQSKETASMRARETTFCTHGSAQQSVPGGGRGSSNKRNPATAGNGKAPVWYHKHWRSVNHTTCPIQMYESA
jgi:hypothetical protein